MKKLFLVLLVIILTACSKTNVVYVDSTTGEVISGSNKSAPVKMMEHLEVDKIVCVGDYQYYQVIIGVRLQHFPVYQSGYTQPAYCSTKTLADGSSL